MTSLEDAIVAAGGPLPLLRTITLGEFPFPIPAQFTNWRDEQTKWINSAILYDISNFGADVYFRGPDARRLLNDTAVNNFGNFSRNQAKQLIAVNYDGYLIDDAIIFALEDDEFLSVGSPMASNWIQFHAQKLGGYDVEITQDDTLNGGSKKYFRFIVQGPTAADAVRKASAGSLGEVAFFKIADLTIDGNEVRAINHTMSGLPGQTDTGFEVYGPSEYAAQVKETLLRVGAEFGLQEGGALSYPTSAVESGWLGMPVPSIYTGDQYREYREWLGEYSWEATTSLGGSFVADDISDYYVTPWELGYDRSISFTHDFIGKEGLLARKEDRSRRKVWLRWNDEDVAKAIASSLFDDEPAKYLSIPSPNYSGFAYDQVLLNDRSVGWSGFAGYTRNIRGFASLAVLNDEAVAQGQEVTLIWGEPNGGSNRPGVERHKQVEIRATVLTEPPVAAW